MIKIKIVTSWSTLIQVAHKLGKARMAYKNNQSNENLKALEIAEKEHDAYRDICLLSDEMKIPLVRVIIFMI